jgi:hypothetical protein
VRIIAETNTQTQKFRGKEILRRFFSEHASKAGFSYATFVYELAKQARLGERLKQLTAPTVVRLRTFVPSGLLQELDAIIASPLDNALRDRAREIRQRAAEARAAWERGVASETNRAELRRDILRLARELHAAQRLESHMSLLRSLSQMIAG